MTLIKQLSTPRLSLDFIISFIIKNFEIMYIFNIKFRPLLPNYDDKSNFRVA